MMPVLSSAHTDAASISRIRPCRYPSALGTLPGRRGHARAAARARRATPTTGGATCRSSKGLYNFDTIRIDYFRDATAMFEAFKAGLIDYRVEDDPTRWRIRIRFSRRAKDGRIAHGDHPERPAERRVGLRLQHPPADVRRPPRSRGAGVDVRLRVDQRQSPRRRVQAFRGLLRRQRIVVGRSAGLRARARLARALPRRRQGRRDGGPVAGADSDGTRTRPGACPQRHR